MDKLKDFIIKNKQLSILIVGLVVMFLLFLTLLPDSKYSGVSLVEQPLFFYNTQKITIPKEVSKKLEINRKGVEIYRLKSDNLNIKVEGIISKLGISAPNKTTTATFLYEWKNKGGDLIRYDTKTQRVNIKLEDKKNIFPSLALPSDEQLHTLLPEFTKKYINESFEYFDTEIVKETGKYIVSGRRKINGIPLVYPGYKDNHDRLELDSNLNLISAEISLLDIVTDPLDRIKLVKPADLNGLISKSAYPKVINQGLPDGLIIKNTDKVPTNSDSFGEAIPNVTTSTISNMELIYYFSNISQQFLIPMYRLDGVGKIVFKGSEYNVDVDIVTSALDPEKVYIPSNISFAD